ncbi:hypothetical protein CC78DRAFT_98034 [Lojkania enalia]|uniref:Uncharacterized protein n=1 Tax=Lojkania enalia TaxID=147567 RepID=A0A9P4K0Z6_9PLEO|nr:hypothetical protein CC78DRAFT_98034 [Didymosphaeria enalia]
MGKQMRVLAAALPGIAAPAEPGPQTTTAPSAMDWTTVELGSAIKVCHDAFSAAPLPRSPPLIPIFELHFWLWLPPDPLPLLNANGKTGNPSQKITAFVSLLIATAAGIFLRAVRQMWSASGHRNRPNCPAADASKHRFVARLFFYQPSAFFAQTAGPIRICLGSISALVDLHAQTGRFALRGELQRAAACGRTRCEDNLATRYHLGVRFSWRVDSYMQPHLMESRGRFAQTPLFRLRPSNGPLSLHNLH